MIATRLDTIGSRRLGPTRRPQLVPVLLGILLVLSGCSIGGGDDEPPTPTAPPISGAAVAGPRLVGELADQINSAWLSVRSYRVTTIQGTGDLLEIPPPSAPVPAATPLSRKSPETASSTTHPPPALAGAVVHVRSEAAHAAGRLRHAVELETLRVHGPVHRP